jgi:glycine cleavage system H protein
MKFSKSHEWVDCKKEVATLGISQEGKDLLGEIVFVDLPQVGKEIQKGEQFCLLEASKAALDLYSPISGKVIAVNESLKKDLNPLNLSPEKEGWLVQVQMTHPKEYDLLMSEAEYRSFVKG